MMCQKGPATWPFAAGIGINQHFPRSARLNSRRGDLTLLINGMPLIHVELRCSGIPVAQACNQIEKYAHEGVFTGLFSLVQVFVAMEPAETLYFANPGEGGDFSLDCVEFCGVRVGPRQSRYRQPPALA